MGRSEGLLFWRLGRFGLFRCRPYRHAVSTLSLQIENSPFTKIASDIATLRSFGRAHIFLFSAFIVAEDALVNNMLGFELILMVSYLGVPHKTP